MRADSGRLVDPLAPGAPTRDPSGAGPAFRTLQLFSMVRLVAAGALLLVFLAFDVPLIGGGATGADAAGWLGAVLGGYLVAALFLVLLALFVQRRLYWQLTIQLAVDIVLITLSMSAAGGLRSGLAILYLLPLTQASVLLSGVPALFVCAIVVLVLLVDSVLRAFGQEPQEALVFQTGLFGAALFAVTGLLRLLSARLSEQERLAQRRGRDLRDQLEVNRMVIAHMEQGVLVVDEATCVRANNSAARALLGFAPDAQLTGKMLLEVARVRPLAHAFQSWIDTGRGTGLWTGPLVPASAGTDTAADWVPRPIRARFSRPRDDASAEYVVFLEDAGALESRAQELKLASMGRLTASIAHEIRNPLAAITQACALLGDDNPAALRQRLIGMVQDNAQRLNQLVDDVLRVVRRDPPLGEDINLREFLREWVAEFQRDRPTSRGAIVMRVPEGMHVRFEYSNLRQVIFNLVDNALRHASGLTGCVLILADYHSRPPRPTRLWVFDDGPGVPIEVRGALFEPFFTTSPRGTGLGLYMAREFALANQASLAFASHRAEDGTARDGFVLTFAPENSAAEEDRLDTITPVLPEDAS